MQRMLQKIMIRLNQQKETNCSILDRLIKKLARRAGLNLLHKEIINGSKPAYTSMERSLETPT